MHKYAYMVWDRNFSYFCDNWRKTEFLAPPSPLPARGSPKRIKERAQGGELQLQFEQKEILISATFLLINLFRYSVI